MHNDILISEDLDITLICDIQLSGDSSNDGSNWP